jgi:hypothetical protein
MMAPHSLIALQEVGRSEFIGNVVRQAARLPPRQNVAFNVRAGRKEKLKETAVNVSSFVNFAKILWGVKKLCIKVHVTWDIPFGNSPEFV